jgi:hypothetical protein
MTGDHADGLSASYVEGKKDGRAEIVKLVLEKTSRIGVLLQAATVSLTAGVMADAAHYLGNARQVLMNLDALLRD